MPTTKAIREQSEDAFAFSFIAAAVTYSIFCSWLNVLPGLAAFVGGFVIARAALALPATVEAYIYLLERVVLLESIRIGRIEIRLSTVEKSIAGKSA